MSWCAKHKNWRRVCPQCHDELEQRRDDLLALVGAVEWDENDQGNVVCPWCHWEQKRDGHAPGCAYKAAMSKVRGQ